jgi:FkbM family methyltransferase
MNDQIHIPKYRDLIYDVGLHRGEDTEFYLRKGFRVVAFEANPELVVFCKNRFAEFINSGRLKVIEGAIIDVDLLKAGQRTARFYRNESGSPWGTVCGDWAERNERMGTTVSVMEVNTVNFKEIIRECGIPHYMKIDIEGCDVVCLKALKDFPERPDYISMESNKTSLGQVREEIDLLGSLGYGDFQALEQTGIPQSQVPPQPAREGNYAAQRFEEGSSGLFGAELGSNWLSRGQILRFYRFVHWGYKLLGDDGIMYRWQFRGASRLRRLVRWFLERMTHAQVPGWYDTHARLAMQDFQKPTVRPVPAPES